MKYPRRPGRCGWLHLWPSGNRTSRSCAACMALGLVTERRRVGHVKGRPYSATLARFEDYADLRDHGLGHDEALARIGVTAEAFERACYRWPAYAPAQWPGWRNSGHDRDRGSESLSLGRVA